MKTRHMLLALGLSGALLTGLVGALGIAGLSWVRDAVRTSTEATRATQAATMGDMMHDALRGDVFQALFLAREGQTAGVDKARREAQEHAQGFQQRLVELRALPLSAAQSADAARLEPLVRRYTELGRAIADQSATDLPGALARLPAFEALFDELAAVQDALIESIEQQQAERQARTEAGARAAWLAMLVAALAGTGALVGLALLLAQRLMKTLGAEPADLRSWLHRIAQGDLTGSIPVRPGDQHSVTASVAEMLKQLRALVDEVLGRADHVAGAAAQVHAGSADLAQRTTQQAGELESALHALEQMSGQLAQGAEDVVTVNRLAGQATEMADRSGQAVQAVVATMDGIQSSSRRIAEIIAVIDGIAFQTNILALNAAVEAARAGDQGRGFAVVAGEVRALAQRSAAAAQDVKSLIGVSVDHVERGSDHVREAGDAGQALVDSVRQVSGLMAGLADARCEQDQGVRRFLAMVRRLEDTTQQNAALVEESTAAASSLNEQARGLSGAMHRFRVAA